MNKKITSSALAALMIAGTTSFSAFASMSIGTVVIGTKAFDINYVNDAAHVAEITNAILAGGTIYVKDFTGNWIDNVSGAKVDASKIPAVTYKSVAGVETKFDAMDKDAVNTLAVTSVSAINLKEVVVTFNKDIDSANAGTYTFSAASGLTATVSKVVGNTVTLTIAGTVTQQLTTDLTIDAAKGKDGVAVATTIKSVKFVDITAPTVLGVAVTAPTKVTVTFSEPLSVKPTFTVDDGLIAIVNDNFAAGTKSVELTLGTTPADGAHTVTVTGGLDYAGFSVDKTVNTLSYTKDVAAPTFTVKSASESTVVLEFNEAVSNVGDSNVEFYQTNVGTSAYKATKSLSADGKTLTLTFANPLPAGNVSIFLNYVSETGAKLSDAWGNKVAASSFTANVVIDATAPTVSKVESIATTTSTKIEVTFSEAVMGATTSANYTLKDSDGVTVPFTNVTLVSGNTYSINATSPLNGGNYALTVKNLTDTSLKANKLADFSATVAIADKVTPTLNTTTPVLLLSAKKVKIQFSEAMDAASITNTNNYLFGSSALDSKVKVTAVDSNKAVILDFTDVLTGTQAGALTSNTIYVGRVSDVVGNLIAGFSNAVTVPASISAALFNKAEVTGANSVKFYFDEVITSLVATDFEVSIGAGVYAPATAISVSIVDGKTVVTATTAQTLPTTATGVVVKTGTSPSGKNSFSTAISITAGTVTADKYAPAALTAVALDADSDTFVDSFTVSYSENLYAASVQDSDFTVEGYEVTGVTASGSTVTITVKEKTTADLSATPKVTQVGAVEDSSRNVKDSQVYITAVAAQVGIDAATKQAAVTALTNKIAAVATAEAAKVEGSAVGNQIVGSKTTLDAAKTAADAVLAAQATKTAIELNAATATLNTAITAYGSAVVVTVGTLTAPAGLSAGAPVAGNITGAVALTGTQVYNVVSGTPGVATVTGLAVTPVTAGTSVITVQILDAVGGNVIKTGTVTVTVGA